MGIYGIIRPINNKSNLIFKIVADRRKIKAKMAAAAQITRKSSRSWFGIVHYQLIKIEY